MASIPALPTFTANTLARAADITTLGDTIRDYLNSNVAWAIDAQTIAGVKTFSSIPVFSNGATITAGGLTVSGDGITVTGNSTITGTLTALTGLTSSGTASLATVTVSANLTMTGGQAIAKRVDDGDSGAADTIDFNTGNIHRSRLTGNCTYTFSNPQTGATYRLEVLQDGTGSRTATWPATVKWDNATTPTLTTTANRKDLFDFYYNGAVYIGTTAAMNVADTT